jgi:hypothetical protein
MGIVSKHAAASATQVACMTLAVMLLASPARAQLISQTVFGAQRICRYNNPVQSQRQARPFVERMIGRGEPCPVRYTAERPPRTGSIPSMATLQGQERVGDRKVCIYGYMGRRYSRTIPPTATCALTPSFSN